MKETTPAITGLRDTELQKLISLPIKENTDRWHTRNLFLFAMYEGGIRIGDAIQMRWGNIVGDRLIYTMSKNGKKVDVILVQEAEKILKLYKKPGIRPAQYIFPYLDSNAEYATYIDYEDRKTILTLGQIRITVRSSEKGGWIKKPRDGCVEMYLIIDRKII